MFHALKDFADNVFSYIFLTTNLGLSILPLQAVTASTGMATSTQTMQFVTACFAAGTAILIFIGKAVALYDQQKLKKSLVKKEKKANEKNIK